MNFVSSELGKKDIICCYFPNSVITIWNNSVINF